MSHSKSEPSTCCSTSSSSSLSSSSVASTELKLYQAFIFSVPIFFAFILIFLFYLFYMRRRGLDWASLRMQTSLQDSNDVSRAEFGLKKEVREMLPVLVYKESFSVRDTQCPVCLGDYEAEDRLQQIPACGHTFHMGCIDHWLANHTTCPLCRLSLHVSAKVPSESPNNQIETGQESSMTGNSDVTSVQPRLHTCEELRATELSDPRNENSRTLQNNAEEEISGSESADEGREFRDVRNGTGEHENNRGFSAA